MASKIIFPTSSEQYEKLYKIGFNAWKARLKSDPEVEVATKLHNVDTSYDKEMIKAEILGIETMCQGQEGFLVDCQCFFVDNVLWIVCDFEAWSEGTIRDIMSLHTRDGGMLDEQLVRAIGNQILGPMEFLHSQGRIFRDLRCKNLMVTSDGKIQLQLLTLPSILQERAPIYKDSLFWASPELLLQERVPGSSMTQAAMAASSSVGTPADVWALGVTLLELALGDPPFSPDMTPSQLFQAIVEGDPPVLPPEIAPLWSKGFKEVIQKCLVKDASQRATIAELKSHPFFSGAPDADYIKEHLLAPLPPIETRWKVISQIREQQEAVKHERREHAEKLAQQAAQFAQSATELPDFSSLGPSIPNSAASSMSAPGGPSISLAAMQANGPSLGPATPLQNGPSLGGPSLGGPSLAISSSAAGGPSLGGPTSNDSTPGGSGSSIASSASTPFPMSSAPVTTTHAPLANSMSAVPNGYNPRGMVSVGSASSLAGQNAPTVVMPVLPLENPFLFSDPAPNSGAAHKASVSTPTPSERQGQGAEPVRGRFRIVNPGSNSTTPSGSIDLTTQAMANSSSSVPGNYNGVQPTYLTLAEGGSQQGYLPPANAYGTGYPMASTSSTNATHSNQHSASHQQSSTRRSSKQNLLQPSPPQNPPFNVPIEAYLGENDRDYIVIFRALPGTMVSISLEGKILVISGQVPPLPSAILKQLHPSERPVSKFERKITFPGEVDPNDFGREIIREQNTMIIRVKKSPKSIHMGDDMF